jgi:AP-3 complex subunit delta-1
MPDTLAVYIHSAAKVFGYWAAEFAQRWDDDLIPEIKNVVDMVLERVGDLISSPYIEVQERVTYSHGVVAVRVDNFVLRQRTLCSCSHLSAKTLLPID